jgi:hypothetical protein
MPSKLQFQRQRDLFKQIEECGDLIFACGPNGISANIVGPFRIERFGSEDLLIMGDGTQHVHIDWLRVKEVEHGDFHGEGMLVFKDNGEVLFRLYRPEGPFPPAVLGLCGRLG